MSWTEPVPQSRLSMDVLNGRDRTGYETHQQEDGAVDSVLQVVDEDVIAGEMKLLGRFKKSAVSQMTRWFSPLGQTPCVFGDDTKASFITWSYRASASLICPNCS